MKKTAILLLVLLISVGLVFGEKDLETPKDKASYAVGYNMGLNLKRLSKIPHMDLLIKGLNDAVENKKSALAVDEMRRALKNFYEMSQKQKIEERKKLGEKNLAEGKVFLEENGKKEGIVTTKSGMQYKVINEGSGPIPGPEDIVELHYIGKTLDGKEFHNSYNKGKPVTFQVQRTYQGWSEALRMMKTGSKWKIFLPAELAFKDRGLGGKVGPNAVVIFELELLGVKPPAPKTEKPVQK